MDHTKHENQGPDQSGMGQGPGGPQGGPQVAGGMGAMGGPGAWGGAYGHNWAPGPMPPYGWHPGFTPGFSGGFQPGYGMPPFAQPSGTAGPPDGFTAALNDIADKNGLGMFKDFLRLNDGEFWKGALVGAAVVLLMTNEDLRASLVGGAAKAAEAVKTGFSGMKENGETEAGTDDGDGE